MLQSFMRPVMLVLGFMIASVLLEAIGGYVTQIYPLVLANVQMDSISGFFSILGFSALFFHSATGAFLLRCCLGLPLRQCDYDWANQQLHDRDVSDPRCHLCVHGRA